MREKLILFPFNGNALEALDAIQSEDDRYEVLGFVDDSKDKIGKDAFGLKVFDRTLFAEHPTARVLAVPGSPESFRHRKEILAGLTLTSERYATIIHPKAQVSPLARIGKNVLILAGAIITSNATIGDHVCILPQTVVHHDVTIGDYSLIGSYVVLSGNTTLEENVYVGSGSCVKGGVRVGRQALVGMGSIVIKNVDAATVVVGNPAKPLRSKTPGAP